MAYAALTSLQLSLNQIMLLYPDQHTIFHDQRKQIQSLLPKLEYLQEFLEDSSNSTSDEKTLSWITRIRDAAHEAQNVVDLYCYQKEMATIRHVPMPKNMDLQKIIQEIDAIETNIKGKTGSMVEEAKKIECPLVPNDSQLEKSFHAGSSRHASRNIMVGSEDSYMQIMDVLMGQKTELTAISITGMGGIGKTTLARKIYNDPSVMYHFDICAWVVVSQSYSIPKILLGILDSMKIVSDEMFREGEDELRERLIRSLKGRRYLMIIDDIWDTSVWVKMRTVFPNDCNGSRILLTTRLADVAANVSSSGHSHHLSLLSSKESWDLLCSQVFGYEACPPELEEIGKKISVRCGGLPLAIVAMGTFLAQTSRKKEAWIDVEKKVKSTDLYSCLQTLKLSYHNLPQRLKACFLYMAHFQEDEEISVSKLIKLWVAEGFLKQVKDQIPEAVAENCLKELINRSMLLVSKGNFDGNIKTCRIHSLLHALCLREANKERFLCVSTSTYVHGFEETPHYYPRISIHSNTPSVNFSNSIPSFSFVRSLLCTGSAELSSSVFRKFKLLRVLDAIKVAFPNFPKELLELLNLRYISFTCLGQIPPSISNLRYLQSLVIHQDHNVKVPVEIWNMTHLRHVELKQGSWPYPIDKQLGNPPVLTNLRTLSGIINLRFTEDVSRRIPSVERLKVSYVTRNEQQGWSYYEFQNLVNLQKLGEAKINLYYHHRVEMKELEFRFPPSLKELTLGGVSFSSDGLSVVGCLPNLEALKLKSCDGHYWAINGGEFPRLKLLLLQNSYLVRWEIYCDQPFPCLEQLIIRDCCNLMVIPSEMGKIPALTKIELAKCNELVVHSAKKIREMRHDIGDDNFQLVVLSTWSSSETRWFFPTRRYEVNQNFLLPRILKI